MTSQRWLVAAGVALALSVAPGPAASAEPTTPAPSKKELAQGQARLKKALQMLEKGDVERASIELERLYTKLGLLDALYYRGRALREAGDAAGAFDAYERYTKATEASPDTEKTSAALGAMQELSPQIARVTVETKAGATVVVDSVEVGTAPLDRAVVVKPGDHTITVLENGEPLGNAKLSVAAEDRKKVRVGLEPEPEPEAPAPAPEPEKKEAPPPPPPPDKPIDYRPIVGFSVAGVLAAGSAVFAVMAVGDANDFSQRKRELAAPRSDLEDMQGTVRMEAAVSAGLGAAALAVAGFTYFKWMRHGGAPRAEKARVGWLVPDAASVGPSSATLRWGF